MRETIPTLTNPGLNGRTIGVATGNTLGGTSQINGAQYIIPVRGTVERLGIEGLTTATARFFYRRAFHTVPQTVNLRNKYASIHLEAAIRSGLSFLPNPFNENPENTIYDNFVTVDRKGFRADSCIAYLMPAMNGSCRNNLKLIQEVMVIRVLFRQTRRPNWWWWYQKSS